jgi:hypothetical protein
MFAGKSKRAGQVPQRIGPLPIVRSADTGDSNASAEAAVKGRTTAHESARPQRKPAESSELIEHSFAAGLRSRCADRVPVRRDVYH